MIAVAVASIPLAIWATIEARRVRFRRMAAYHESQVVSQIAIGIGGLGYGILRSTPQGEPVDDAQAERDWWHLDLSRKYQKAAERPWMPVAPDPRPPNGSESGKS
jgi:hypothetical protein